MSPYSEEAPGSEGTPGKPVVAGIRPILVTGGAGFIGCNLVDRLAAEGHHVIVYDALRRQGVEENLAWLKQRHPSRVSAIVADICDRDALAEATVRAQAVFHYAAQVAVTSSMIDPVLDFEVNARGTLLLLDALRRRNDRPPLIFASTNKVYGNLSDVWLDCIDGAYLPTDPTLRRYGISEDRPLDFHTPYGCSKGCADQYVLDWARSFGVPTVVLRMSCIYGPHQFGTEDQGWVAHFLRQAIAGNPISIYGDGKQVRDVLHVRDAVAAYLAAWRKSRNVQATAFNLGGGPRNAVSLLQIIGEIERRLGRKIEVSFEDWRPGDQRYFVADTRRARAALGLPVALDWRAGVADLADWFLGTSEGTAIRPQPSAVELAS
jgi:CDP-paratose 2-epimerase